VTATTHLRTITHRIGGVATHGSSTRKAPVWDPASGRRQAKVVLADVSDVDAAVASASDAFAAWRDVSLARRSRVLFAFRDSVQRHVDDLAEIIASEHGKVLADAKGEVARGLEVVDFACGIPQLLKGEFSDQVSTGVDAYSFRQPLGVCAGITPFNFPAMVPLWMAPLAIACGNSFILKPSERDPSASNMLADLWQEAGLPDGVFNVVHGDKIAVDALTGHQDIKAVSFVGSTPVAKYVYETSTRAGKRVQALGGAKNHAVVMPDADLDFAAHHLVAAGYGSAGQRCMAISIVVAVAEAADPLIAKLKEEALAIKVGPGLDPGNEMGPIVTPDARDRIARYVEAGIGAGAEAVLDGRDINIEGEGFWLGPTLFDRVTPEMSVYTDEIFGPVVGIVRVATLAEAIALISSNAYANGACVFTRSGEIARRFQREVEVGMIGINVPIPVPMAYYSFGGWKASLFGDHHVHGAEGVRFYTRAKAVTSRWPEGLQQSEGDGSHLNFPTSA
jgi:malonate-semialdehyde dehydrogenase (acetylating) / methylmalonate-semialdehyde dehydrogenase